MQADTYAALLCHHPLPTLRMQMSRLLTALNEPGPPSDSSEKFRSAYALLRLVEVKKLQALLERAVADYAALRDERRAAGPASKVSRSLQRRRKARAKKARAILAELGVWRQMPDLPRVDGDEVVMCLPLGEWSEAALQQLYEGAFPWRLGEGGLAQLTLAVLAEKYRDAAAEVGFGGG